MPTPLSPVSNTVVWVRGHTLEQVQGIEPGVRAADEAVVFGGFGARKEVLAHVEDLPVGPEEGRSVQADSILLTVLVVVMDCDLAQGHYLSRALTEEELELWLSQSRWVTGPMPLSSD